MVLLAFVWVLNLGISFWNAYAVGNAWVEAKHAGGWRRFIAWMGAIMADIGFTWCVLIVLGFGLRAIGKLDDYWLEVLMNLGYVAIIFPLLFAGYAIMLNNWQAAYRERSLVNMGFAAQSTYANFHNTYHAVNGFGDSLDVVLDAFAGKGKSKDSGQALVVLLAFGISIGLGTIITWMLISHFAGRDEPMPYDSYPVDDVHRDWSVRSMD